MLTKSYGIVLSNIITSAVIVNHDSNDPVIDVFMYNDKDHGKTDTNYTPALISGPDITVDLKNSNANSIKYLKIKSSKVSTLEVMLPEFGTVDMGRIEYVKADYKDLSSVPESSPLDTDRDGIKLITLERLASEDNDGDDGKLTIPCRIIYINDNTVYGMMNMSVLLPDVAAAWGDNSHIKDATPNYKNTGSLAVVIALSGQKEIFKVVTTNFRYKFMDDLMEQVFNVSFDFIESSAV
jgi:hypothetical protein